MSCSWITSKTNSELMSVGMDGQVGKVKRYLFNQD